MSDIDNKPTGMTLVTETTGFVTTKGARGPCFEWYMAVKETSIYGVVNTKWKATHILHEENWLLPKVN